MSNIPATMGSVVELSASPTRRTCASPQRFEICMEAHEGRPALGGPRVHLLGMTFDHHLECLASMHTCVLQCCFVHSSSGVDLKPMHMQIVAATCELAYPHLASKLLEAAQRAAVTAAADGSAGGSLWHLVQSPPPSFIPIFLLISVSAFGETIFAALRAVCSTMVTVKTVKQLRAKVFGSLLAQEVLWFQPHGRDSASLASRISNDCEAVARIVSINFNVALRYGVQAVGGLAYLGCANPAIAALCLITTILMCAISLKCALDFLPYAESCVASKACSPSRLPSSIASTAQLTPQLRCGLFCGHALHATLCL